MPGSCSAFFLGACSWALERRWAGLYSCSEAWENLAPPRSSPAGEASDGASGSGSSSAAGSTPTAAYATCDAGLYADLLRRANGDQNLVNLWLAEMGFKCDPSMAASVAAQVQSGSGDIKAVGKQGNQGGAIGPLASAWNSLTALRGSPAKTDALRSTPGGCAALVVEAG